MYAWHETEAALRLDFRTKITSTILAKKNEQSSRKAKMRDMKQIREECEPNINEMNRQVYTEQPH